MTNYKHLFSEMRIGRVTVKNRIVMPPMATNFGNTDGSVSKQIIDYYEARAKGGVGLIIIENASVDYPRGKDVSNELRLDDMKFAAGYHDLAETIHSYGTKVLAQIHQCGSQTTLAHSEGVELISPSGIPCPKCQTQPKVMTIPEIKELVQAFVNAAKWAQVAGCDGVEVHGAHGYIIQQFMSPATNKRVDEYGGTLERRMRFPLEIVKGIREVCGDKFIICFRMSVDEFIDDGYHLETGIEMAKMLEEAGVDLLHASAGCYGAAIHSFETQGHEQGERLYIAQAVKEALNIPVIAVGMLRTPDVCEKAIAEGKTDFVALGRTLIADPEWANKAKENRADEIRKCASCLYCLGHCVHPGKRMRCSVNPECGYEGKYEKIQLEEIKKRVAVVGGGPAGMTAAIYAAKRGYEVILLEKEEKLGGQLGIASVPPDKDVIKWIEEYLVGEVQRQGVDVRIGVKADAELLKSLNVDHIILATGSKPLIPNMRGIDLTVSSWDILNGSTEIKEQNIVIMGGGVVGSETAHFLAKQGKDVTIIDMLSDIAIDLEPTTRGDLLEKLEALRVKKITNAIVTEISEKGISYILKNGRSMFVEAEKVVLSIGQKPVTDLKEDLEKIEIPYTVIGDADEIGMIVNATRNGLDSAMHI